MHKFSTGLNFTYDQYDEMFTTQDWSRIDNSVGAFFEYTYCNDDDFSVVAGLRVDNHNRLGTFLTPRIHSRYEPWKGGTLKASVGEESEVRISLPKINICLLLPDRLTS